MLIGLTLTACGGSGATTLVMNADPDSLPPGADLDSALQETVNILRQRLVLFGEGDSDITSDGETITASVSGMDGETARALLMPRGVVEFRQPVIVEGFVLCTDADGEEFLVHPLRVNPDEALQNRVRCFAENQFGDPLWEPTPTIQIRTQKFALAELIEPGSWEIRNQTSLAPQFNDDGSELLEEVTGNLVGYPLGVFVDGELLGAPRIRRAITNGNPFISGFTELEARLRRAQFNVPPLPVTLLEGVAPG